MELRIAEYGWRIRSDGSLTQIRPEWEALRGPTAEDVAWLWAMVAQAVLRAVIDHYGCDGMLGWIIEEDSPLGSCP